jgi:hypothetical protein
MLITPILVGLLFPVCAADGEPASIRDVHIQIPDAHQSGAPSVPILLSMGPDPGGKTGATVNSETTKTGQPNADSAMSRNSSNSSKPAGGAEHGSAQSQGTTSGSDRSMRDAQEKRR